MLSNDINNITPHPKCCFRFAGLPPRLARALYESRDVAVCHPFSFLLQVPIIVIIGQTFSQLSNEWISTPSLLFSATFLKARLETLLCKFWGRSHREGEQDFPGVLYCPSEPLTHYILSHMVCNYRHSQRIKYRNPKEYISTKFGPLHSWLPHQFVPCSFCFGFCCLIHLPTRIKQNQTTSNRKAQNSDQVVYGVNFCSLVQWKLSACNSFEYVFLGRLPAFIHFYL